MERNRTIISPPHTISLGLKELWKYRELLYFFAWRDIKVKYKQTYLGVAWALIQPLALMLLFTYIFSRNLHFTSSGMKYEIYVLSGLILWNLFNTSTNNASEGIIQQSGMIRKIYFPRLVIPISSLIVALFDFSIAFVLFLIFCIIYDQPMNINALFYFPVAILLTCLFSIGTGTILSALTVKYRDFRYAVPFMIQFLFFASTIVYSFDSLHQIWLKYLLALNPVNGAIELFRVPFTGEAHSQYILISLASAIIITFAGVFYFRKSEAYFADLA